MAKACETVSERFLASFKSKKGQQKKQEQQIGDIFEFELGDNEATYQSNDEPVSERFTFLQEQCKKELFLNRLLLVKKQYLEKDEIKEYKDINKDLLEKIIALLSPYEVSLFVKDNKVFLLQYFDRIAIYSFIRGICPDTNICFLLESDQQPAVGKQRSFSAPVKEICKTPPTPAPSSAPAIIECEEKKQPVGLSQRSHQGVLHQNVSPALLAHGLHKSSLPAYNAIQIHNKQQSIKNHCKFDCGGVFNMSP